MNIINFQAVKKQHILIVKQIRDNRKDGMSHVHLLFRGNLIATLEHIIPNTSLFLYIFSFLKRNWTTHTFPT